MHLLLATSNPHKLDEVRAVFDALRRDRLDAVVIELRSLADLALDIAEPVEDRPTFEGNAMLKARYYARAAGTLCLADDSGLEVDALNGEPGVPSARYAGVAGPRSVVDPANNRLLLHRLAGVPAERRTARFVCAMALWPPLPPGEGWGEGVRGRAGAHRAEGADDAPSPIRAHPHPPRFARHPLPEGEGQEVLVRGTIEGRVITPAEAADLLQPHLGRGKNGFGYDPLFLVPELGRTTAELEPAHKNAISHRGRAARLMWEQLQRLFAGPRVEPRET